MSAHSAASTTHTVDVSDHGVVVATSESVLAPVCAVAPAPVGYTSTKGLAVAALAAAGVLTLLEVVDAATAFSSADAYADAARFGYPLIDVWTTHDGLTLLVLPMLLTAYVLSCLWLWAARRNGEVLAPREPHARSRGWVWGGWLVPVVCLWFPYQVVRDVRRASEADHEPTRAPATGLWWTAWLIWLAVDGVSNQLWNSLSFSAYVDPAVLEVIGPLEWLHAAVTVVALAVWVPVVLATCRAQDQKAARLGLAPRS